MAASGRASKLVLAWALSQLLALAPTCAAEVAPGVLAEPEESQEGLCALQLAAHRTDAAQSFPFPCKDRNSVPVFVMMSLTMVSNEGVLNDPGQLRQNLTKLKAAGVTGVMTDCWWGITEPEPRQYRFGAYKELVQIAKEVGLKMQFVTSFHQCGSPSSAATGSCYLPLPHWVRQEEGIWYTNAYGHITKAYISLFADNVKVGGRTPIEMYKDWFHAFSKEFRGDFGTTIVEMMIGMGTDGELKYPSYENGNWTFPGIGMPQAFDQYARKSLEAAALKAGDATWGVPPGAEETGGNDAVPADTPFYKEGGGYTTPRGKFFLEWYSKALIHHAGEVLSAARWEFGYDVKMAGKISGVHWWYKYPSHPAEANAGYYNTNNVDGYGLLIDIFKPTRTLVDFTCLEMTDASQPPDCDCGPQELVIQVQSAAFKAGLPFTGENALNFYDAAGYDQMMVWKPSNGYVSSISYMRISDELLEKPHLDILAQFCAKMSDPDWVTPFTITNLGVP